MEATNAQVDTLILDNRKKLNQIIGRHFLRPVSYPLTNRPSDSILQACVHKVDEAIYELESPTQAGNLNSTPEYTLSMIEKTTNNATEFATVFLLYLGGEVGGDHVEVIKTANELVQSLSDVLINTRVSPVLSVMTPLRSLYLLPERWRCRSSPVPQSPILQTRPAPVPAT